MCITKFYQRRLALAVLLLATAMILFLRLLCRNIPDSQLDAHTLALHTASSFNPRSIAYSIYTYMGSLSSPEPFSAANLANVAHLGNRNGVYFHWDDWVDLSIAKNYLDPTTELYPDGKCEQALRDYASVNPYFMESYNTKVLRGMVNLYCVKDVPKRILAASDSGFMEISVLGKKRIGSSNMPKRVTKSALVKNMEETEVLLSSPGRFESAVKFHPYKKMQQEVDINPQDFVFEPDAQIFTLKEALNKNTILPDDLQYLQFLEAANAQVDSADRFFKYPWIYTDLVAGRSHHTSFPFFKRYISNRERQSVLQHIVRVWFQFAESQGINSWINYGSLLGWAYNGVNMPWDTDIDIQLPIAQLDKLSRKFNSTLIIENPRDGNAKYLFEVSPTYIRQGNGRNFIDARLIDINSGLYIDLSALSHTAHQAPAELHDPKNDMAKLMSMPVHCKNWNWHSLDELLPIRHTFFEGASVYIPKNVLSILRRKYGADSFTTKLQFNSHRYRPDLSMWVPEKECRGACGAALSLFGNSKLLAKCRSQWLEDEVRIVSRSAGRHKLLNLSPDERVEYDTTLLEDLPIFRKDAWDYFNDISNKLVTNTDWFVTA